MDPLISVVVPVYNVEQYLEQCVESIRNQTYNNLEIILVDDGSTDNCPTMCDWLAEKDNRIKVIHKENGGVSESRNIGIESATGKYITFVDSDDYIDENMIATLYSDLKKGIAEISACNYQVVTQNLSISHKAKGKEIIYSREQIIEKYLYQKIANSPWGILVPIEICQKELFPVGYAYGEDLATVYKYFLNCNKVAYHFDKLYFYRKNPNGAVQKPFNDKMLDEINVVNEIVNFFRSISLDLLTAAKSRKYSTYAKLLRKIPRNTSDMRLLSTKKDLWVFLQKYRWQMMRDSKARIKNRVGAMCTIFGCKIFSLL